MSTFSVSVVTPERAVLETEARFVVLPAHDGELGILHNRAPLLVELASGPLKIEVPEGDEIFFIAGGFAQMVDNRLSILTEEARRPGEIDRAAAEKELADARTLPLGDERQKAIERARAQLKIAGL